MNAIDKLEAAIDKLEALKNQSSPAPWVQGFRYDGEWIDKESDTVGMVRRGDGTVFSPIHLDRGTKNYQGRYVDARLIVTLHRTVDAVLAILQAAVDSIPIWVEDGASEAEVVEDLERELALADAILGD